MHDLIERDPVIPVPGVTSERIRELEQALFVANARLRFVSQMLETLSAYLSDGKTDKRISDAIDKLSRYLMQPPPAKITMKSDR